MLGSILGRVEGGVSKGWSVVSRMDGGPGGQHLLGYTTALGALILHFSTWVH